MKRLGFIVALGFTCILTAVGNLLFERLTSFNLFSLSFWFVVPAGAAIVGAAAASGGVLAAKYLHLPPRFFDALLMVAAAAFTMWLIYYLDYLTFVLPDGRRATDIIDFRKYVDLVMTSAELRVGRGAHSTGKIGDLGYWLAVTQFVGFLFGGLSMFGFLSGMPRCVKCGSYLRKLKTKSTPDISFDEAEKLLEYMRRGDISTYRKVIGWTADRKFSPNEQIAKIKFDLQGCPKCKSESIEQNVLVSKNGEWKDLPALKERLTLGEGDSLRDSF